LFKHLDPPSYYFLHTNPPKPYQLNHQKSPFTIKQNQTQTTILTPLNHIIKRSPQFTKIPQSRDPLQAPHFNLLDQDP
ncbi:hypothetical protein, partial [Bacillus sp. WP8]|uniref:hypothetical protein n=1 Tax=Bacillus sp. WP8 TaxID=756828 RepID=UPI001C92F030